MDNLSDASESMSEPHLRRVGIASPPANFRLSTSTTSTAESVPSSPPSIPPRSPLRLTARKASGQSALVFDPSETAEGDDNMPPLPLLHSRSFGNMPTMLDARTLRPKTPEKPLPIPPSSVISLISLDDDEEDMSPSTSAPSSLLLTPAAQSKRTFALLELLSSERAYASDLALIRDIHIPLALGQPAPFQTTPLTPSASSGSSLRTVSTASDSSSGSALAGPPMSKDDVRIIFNNVAELAVFSDSFTERLEEALGGVLEGGSGEDHVGALFLEMIPTLEPLYKSYITKHPTALEHLSGLASTPALTAYLAHTQTLASSLSHAWDLPSLLIKPVQRLLKYSLLLGAIIEETPDSHSDKTSLKLAREKMEEVARGVNEGRRRREVVKEVLLGSTSTSPGKKVGDTKPKKKGLNIGVAASVSLGRMKNLRAASSKVKAKEGAEANQEAEEVNRLGDELKRCEMFIRKLAKDALEWADTMQVLMQRLRDWAVSFGRVIWVAPEEKSEAFDAFVTVVTQQLMPLCEDLGAVLKAQFIPQLTNLVNSMLAPSRLLEAMHTLEPLHYGLLNLNVSKSRPPPQLLEASQSYVALRAQLFAELPDYLSLLDRGIMISIIHFARWQAAFWNDVRERWSNLWDALKVDGEMNAGSTETLRVWWSRFAEVEAMVSGLNIVRQPEKKAQPPEVTLQRVKPRTRSLNDQSDAASSLAVSSVLSALDPLRSAGWPDSPEFDPPSRTMKTRGAHSIDMGNRRYVERRPSDESLRSKKSGKSGKSAKSNGTSAAAAANASGYEVALSALSPSAHESKPSYSRTKSMPIPQPLPLKKSNSHGRLLEVSDGMRTSSSLTGVVHIHPSGGEQYAEDDDRGRISRKTSFKRRLTEGFRASPASSNSRHRRSPSLPSFNSYGPPSPSPKQPVFSQKDTRGGRIPSMYECRVVHPCEPPPGVSYKELPFFTLRVNDEYEVLQEAGHPSTHPDLPLYVDDGEDCLLLVRNAKGVVGWALASFLVPVD